MEDPTGEGNKDVGWGVGCGLGEEAEGVRV